MFVFPVCLSLYLSSYVSVHLSICLPFYVSVCLLTLPITHHAIPLSISLSIHPYFSHLITHHAIPLSISLCI
jgi:hypothetical protein